MDVESEASLRERLRADPAHFGSVLADFRDRLRRMVDLRLDPRLRARLDASDVVQEACVEAVEQLRAALESMKREDREVLVMRHFEQLTNGDVARLLGLSSGGASLRFMRAAKRLREILDEVSGSKG